MKRQNFISRFLISTLLASACLLLSSPLSFGDTAPPANTDKVDCRLAPNPDECYRQQSQGSEANISGLPLSTSSLGWGGPLTGELKYDSDLAWILGLNYVHMFSQSAGLGVKLTGGANELRGNITTGFALTKDQQVKLTYEYLTQNLPFDFASGTINQWVAQHSLGAAYQYVVRHEVLHSLELSGYSTRAGSQDLSEVIFNQDASSYDVNYRRIAGGSENTVLASANLYPFANKKTALTLGAGYSSVSYDTQYQENPSASTMAIKTELTHILSPKTKLTTAINRTAAMTEYSAKVGHILPKQNLELSLKGQYNEGQVGMPNSSSLMVGVTYPAPKTQTLAGFTEELQQLKSWIEKPVVYQARVLAIKDEMVKRYQFQSNATIPDQTKELGQSIDPVNSAAYFTFSDPNVQVTFDVLTTKTSLQKGQSKATASSADFTKALGLELVSTGPNQVTLQSKTPIPVEEMLVGTYVVTITATGTRSGLSQPLVAKQTFNLTVLTNGPQWSSKPLPSGVMGEYYGTSPAGVDLNSGYVSNNNAPSDTYTFTLVSQSQPDLLSITPDGHLISVAPIPNTAQPVDTIQILATSNSGLGSVQKGFSIDILQKTPRWTQRTYNYTMTYGDSSFNVPLNALVNNNAGLGVVFNNQQTIDPSGVWEIKQNGANLTLQQVSGQFAPISPPPTSLVLVATNTTSTSSDSATFNITVNAAAPVWTSAVLTPDTIEQGDTPSYDLNAENLVSTPFTTGHTYTFSTPQGLPTGWHLSANGKTLTADTTIATGATQITLLATDDQTSLPTSNSKSFTITVNPPSAPVWTSATLIPSTIEQGDTPSYDLNAQNLVSTPNASTQHTYTFSAPSGLPTGWQLVNGKTLTADTTIATGPTQITLSAVDDQTQLPTANSKSFTITVNPASPPVWTSATLTPDTVNLGDPISYDLNTQNLVSTPNASTQHTYTFSAPSGLPSGWQLVNGKTLTADTTIATGPTQITLSAIDDQTQLPTANTKTFTVTVNPAVPVWTSATLTPDTIMQGDTASYNLNTENLVSTPFTTGHTYTFSAPNGLPTGWQLSGDGKTLTADTTIASGATQITLLATDDQTSLATSNTKTFTITVNPAAVPVWTSAILTPDTVTVGDPISYDLNTQNLVSTPNATTGHTYTFSAPSGLPAGWQLVNGKTLTADTTIATGPTQITLLAEDDQTQLSTADTKTFTITVNPAAPVWTSATLTPDTITQGDTPSYDLNTQNLVSTPYTTGHTYTFSAPNGLPTGWSLSTNGQTLTVDTTVAVGQNQITLLATDDQTGLPTSASKTFSVTVNAPSAPEWTSATLTPDTINVGDTPSYDLNAQNLVTTPNATTAHTYTFSAPQGLPTGWNLSGDGKTLTVDTTVVVGQNQVTLSAIDDQTQLPTSAPKTFNVTVNPAIPVWTSATLTPDTITQGDTPVYDLNAENLVSTPFTTGHTYTFSAPNGLPTGWHLSTDGQTLTVDTNVAVGQYLITLLATDDQTGQSTATVKAFDMTVNAPLPPEWTSAALIPDTITVGDTPSYDLNAQNVVTTPNTTTPHTYTFSAPQGLPTGWSLSTDGQTLSVDTTVVVGQNQITLSAIDDQTGLPTATTKTFTVTVNPAAPVWTSATLMPDTMIQGDTPTYDLNAENLVSTPYTTGHTYTFSAPNGLPTGWNLSTDGQTLTADTTVALGQNQITLLATDNQTGLPTATLKTFIVTVNAPSAPVWTSATLTPDTINVGDTPTYDLNAQNLVSTPNATTSHTYTFSAPQGLPTGWNLSSDGKTLTVDATVALGQNQVTLLATDDQTGLPTANDKPFTVMVNPAAPVWTSATLMPSTITKGDVTTYDLNAENLVSTPYATGHTYTFSAAPGGLPTGWQLSTDGKTLTADTAVVAGQNQITLLATDDQTSLPTATSKTFSVTVNVPAAPIWTSATLQPSTINVGDTPTYDLNAENLVMTPGTVTPHTYTFSVPSSSPLPTGWQLSADGKTLTVDTTVVAGQNQITLLATDDQTQLPTSTPKTFSITVNPAVPVWTSATLTPSTINVGDTPTYDLNAENLVSTPFATGHTYTFSAPSGLPTGWNLSTDGKTLTVDATVVVGQNQITLSAKDDQTGASTAAPKIFTVTVDPALPVWTSATLTPDTITQGDTPTYDLNAENLVSTPGTTGHTYTFSAPSGLPTGWNLSTDGKTLTVDTTVVPGQNQITLQALDDQTQLSTAPKTFVVTVNPAAPVWTSATLTPSTINVSGTPTQYDLNAQNLVSTPFSTGHTYTFSAPNGLPTGWSLSTDGQTLTVDATVATLGQNQVTLLATDNQTGVSTVDNKTFTVTVDQALPVWTSATLMPDTITVGDNPTYVLNDQNLVSTPFTTGHTYTFSAPNGLPTGWNLSTDGKTLTVDTTVVPGQNQITLLATDDQTGFATVDNKTFTVTVKSAAPVWTSATLTPSAINVSGTPTNYDLNNQNLVSTPYTTGHTYTFSLPNGSTLPVGWTLSTDGKTLTVDSTQAALGQNQITLLATDDQTGVSTVDSKTFTVTVNPALPVWTSATLTPSTIRKGDVTDYDLNAENLVSTPYTTGHTYTFSAPNGLPTGWSLSTDGQTLTADTTVATGQNKITLKATDDQTGLVTQTTKTFTVTVNAASAPVWTSATLVPNPIRVGDNPTYDLNAEGLVRTPNAATQHTYTFSVPNNDLPTGWNLSTDGKTLTVDTTVVVGQNQITLLATDDQTGKATTSTKTFTVTVNPALPVWTSSTLTPATIIQGDTPTYVLNTQNLVTTPYTTGHTYTFSTPNGLPTGWNLSTDGQTLTADTTVVTGQNQITLLAKDDQTGDTTTANKTFTVTVNAPSAPVWTSTILKPDTILVGQRTNYTLNNKNLVTTPNATNAHTYTFSTPSGLPAGWTLSTDGKTLTATANAALGPTQIILSAKDDQTLLSTADPKPFTITVEVNDTLVVSWTSVNTLPDGTTNTAYGTNGAGIDLNTYVSGNKRLLTTANTSGTQITTDNYTFQITDQTGTSGWYIDSSISNQATLRNNNITDPNGTVKLTMTAYSVDAGNKQVTIPQATQQFTINIMGPPAWIKPVVGSVQFDALVPSSSQGLRLTGGSSPFITPTGSNFSISLGGSYPNWQVVQSGGDWYLVRKSIVVAGGNVAIDGSDISTTQPVKLIAQNSVGSTQTTANVTVNPDVAVTFNDGISTSSRTINVGSSAVTVSSSSDPVYTSTPAAAYTSNTKYLVAFSPAASTLSAALADPTMTYTNQSGLSWVSYSSSAGSYSFVTATPTDTFADYPLKLNVTNSKAGGAVNRAVSNMPKLQTMVYNVPIPSDPPGNTPDYTKQPLAYAEYMGNSSTTPCDPNGLKVTCRVVTALTVSNLPAGTNIKATTINYTPGSFNSNVSPAGLCAGNYTNTPLSQVYTTCVANTATPSNGQIMVAVTATGGSGKGAPSYNGSWPKFTTITLSR